MFTCENSLFCKIISSWDGKNKQKKYQEAVALLPSDKEQAVREYCDAIFDSGADAEQFFYRLGLRDGIRLQKIIKNILKKL